MAELPEDFDLAALLAPIQGDSPVGVDLRGEEAPNTLYFQLRDARRQAQAAERRAEAPPDPDAPAPPDPLPLWLTVRDLATTALAEHTKDLEIAAWLTEALVRSDELLGATAGFQLLTGLVENFWENLFPLPDQDDEAARVAAIDGFNGTLSAPLRQIVVFERPDHTQLEYWQYKQSVDLISASPEARQQRIDAGVVPYDTLMGEVQQADHRPFSVLLRRAGEAAQAWQRLGEALAQRAGDAAPSTSRLREVFDELLGAARALGGTEIAASAEPASDAPTAGDGVPAAAAVQAPGATALASREDALRALGAIAEYFRRSEPHSPLSYTLQEAVRRARMSWPELLEEIVPDQNSRAAILNSLGIRPTPTS